MGSKRENGKVTHEHEYTKNWQNQIKFARSNILYMKKKQPNLFAVSVIDRVHSNDAHYTPEENTSFLLFAILVIVCFAFLYNIIRCC